MELGLLHQYSYRVSGIFLITRYYPEVAIPGLNREIDLKGIAGFILLLVPLFLALSCGGVVYNWISSEIFLLFVWCILMIPVFIICERKAVNPLIPLRHYKNRVYVIAVLISFLTMGLMYACIIYLPLYMQDVLNSSASESGLVITPMIVTMILTSYIAGQLISRLKRYKILAISGVMMILVGFVILVQISLSFPLWMIIAGTILLGAGIGMMHPVLTIAAQNEFPVLEMGLITSSLQFYRNMGGTVLTPLYGFLLATVLQTSAAQSDLTLLPPSSLVFAIHLVFVLCIIISLISLILTFLMKNTILLSKEEQGNG